MGRNKIRAADPFCKNKDAIKLYRNGLRPGMKSQSINLEPVFDDTKLSKREQKIADSIRQGATGEVIPRRRSHVADTRGLSRAERLASQKQKEKPVHKFQTEIREGESFNSYSKRMGEEKRRVLVTEAPKLKTGNAKTKKYLQLKKEKKMDKKLEKMKDAYEEKRFRGEIDHVRFGEVAERPPSFDDLPMSKFKQPGATRMSDLQRLQQAVRDAEMALENGSSGPQKMVRTKVELDSESEDEASQQPRAVSFEERQKMLARARNDMRKAEVDRARDDAQKAYREMKSKNHRGNGIGMSSMHFASAQLSAGNRRAQQALHEIDG